jgi:hypothetical protein
MKHLLNGAWRRNTNSLANHKPSRGFIYNSLLITIVTSALVSGCKRENSNSELQQPQSANSRAANLQGNAVSNYTNLSSQTLWELQQARAATAKYQDIQNAIRDGYADIAVDVEGMGHHFMKTSIVDSVFDIRQPEILVYNKNEDGKQELVAVEYAVPLNRPMPEGFTGSNDVWNGTSGFPFWLLHAWVWAYNPDGVFNWTNPTVHLH